LLRASADCWVRSTTNHVDTPNPHDQHRQMWITDKEIGQHFLRPLESA